MKKVLIRYVLYFLCSFWPKSFSVKYMKDLYNHVDIGTTIHNVSFLFLYLFYISGFVDCETLHGKVKCSLCFPCKKTDICSIQIKEGSCTRGVCLFILAVFLKNYVQIKTKRISSGHIRTNQKIIHCIKLFTLSQSSPHFTQVKCS